MPGQTLAQLVRSKHPGAYDDLNDQALEAAVRAKYPGVYDDIPGTDQAPKPQGPHQPTDAEWAAMPVGEKMRNVLQFAGKAIGGSFFGPNTSEMVENPGTTLAGAALPGVIGFAASHGGPAIQAAARGAIGVLDKPVVGGAIGAADGYRRGGVEGAILEGAAGAAGTSRMAKYLKGLVPARVDPVAAGMSRASQPRSDLDPAALLEAAIQRGLAKGEATRAGAPTLAPAHPTASPKAANTLEQEILARISAEPDWRTVDAVPRDAMKAKGIIEPGESRIGLGERLAQLGKDPVANAAEIERLAKAARQRMHISEKAGR